MKAFSTLEMLIAMTVLVLCISAVAMLAPTTRSTAVDAELDSEALSRAQEMNEVTQSLARKDFKLVVPTTTTEIAGPITYTKRTDVVTQPDFFTKKITSTVSWGGQYGRAQSVSLTGLVSNFQNNVGGDTCDSVLTGNWATPQTTNVLLGTVLGDTNGTYPITSIDVHNKKMYVVVNQAPQFLGPNNGVSAANDTSVGTLGWVNPANAANSNNQYANRTLSGTAVTNYVKVSNFGFAIPQGATILGINVEIEKFRSGGSQGDVRDSQVKIIRADGTIGATNKAQTSTNWSTSETFVSYGGASDLWGETNWSPSAINDTDFGVAIAVTGSSGSTNRVANIDSVRITVTYIKEFYVLDISTPTNPTFVSGLNNNIFATGFNAVHVATSSGVGYAYVATNAGPATGQLQIVNLNTNPPSVSNTFVVPGVTGTGAQAVGNALFYKDGYVYLGLTKTASGPEFNIIDVHNPLAPQKIGSYAVGSGVNDIFVRGNYAYLATSDNVREFMALNISDPVNPLLAGVYDAPGSTGFGYGRSLYAVGDTLYGGRTYVSNAAEFSILDVTNPTVVPPLLGSRDVGIVATPYSVNGAIVRDTLAFLLTNSGTGGRVEIANIQNPGTIPSPTTISLPNAGGGVSLDCEGNYMYAASVPTSGSFINRGSISIITAP